MAHDGSLGMAHAYIDAVAKAGAGAVKFQRHEPSEGGEWRVPPPHWSRDVSRQAYWRRTAFSDAEWIELAKHADDLEMLFLCSTFTVEAAEAMDLLLPAWKVASGQVTNTPMLDYMAAYPKPTIISCGMATIKELTEAGRKFEQPVWLHCTSLYPTPLDQVGLHKLLFLGSDGLSDHSGTIWPSLAAATMGAAMVEVHVTFSRQSYGLDTSSSITLDELASLCEGIHAVRLAQQSVDREALLEGPLAEARRIYMGVNG